MPPSFPFTPCYLGVRHLLKLDIFLTSVRRSWTELHEGAAFWMFGKRLKTHAALWMPRWRANFLFSFMCAIIEFCTVRMDCKVAVLKIGLARLCWEWSCFYTQYCWILSLAFGLLRSYFLTTLFFFSCVGYMTIGITLYQKPHVESCFTQTSG